MNFKEYHVKFVPVNLEDQDKADLMTKMLNNNEEFNKMMEEFRKQVDKARIDYLIHGQCRIKVPF